MRALRERWIFQTALCVGVSMIWCWRIDPSKGVSYQVLAYRNFCGLPTRRARRVCFSSPPPALPRPCSAAPPALPALSTVAPAPAPAHRPAPARCHPPKICALRGCLRQAWLAGGGCTLAGRRDGGIMESWHHDLVDRAHPLPRPSRPVRCARAGLVQTLARAKRDLMMGWRDIGP